MRTWDVFYPLVLPDVIGCPEPLVDQHLVMAAREFCSTTRCWRETLDRIRMRAGRTDYDLSFPTGADGVRLIGATLGGQDIGVEGVDATSLGDRRRGTGGSRRIRSTDMRTVTVLPAAGDGEDLRIEAVLQPAEDADGMPDAIADHYRRMIARGAVSSLLLLNKKPWTNVALAGVLRSQFDLDMARTKSIVWKGHTNTRPRNAAQFF